MAHCERVTCNKSKFLRATGQLGSQMFVSDQGSYFPADMYFTNRTIITARMLEDVFGKGRVGEWVGRVGGLTYDPVAAVPLKGKKVKTRICTLSHAWNLELVDIFSLTNIFRVQCSQTVHSKYMWLYTSEYEYISTFQSGCQLNPKKHVELTSL